MNGSKFSVIIPTMWYSDKIFKLLDNLESSPFVGEILLIDNNKGKRPAQINDTDKITILEQSENIYVNPAWNLGVEKSKYENICISNDDLVWDVGVLSHILDNIHLGIIGQACSNYDRILELNPKIQPMIGRESGWGCCFFIHKSKWKPIPSELKIACGDDYLIKNIPAFMVSGLPLEYEQVSITSIKLEFFQIQQNDINLWSQY
jgi:hypothetical protein